MTAQAFAKASSRMPALASTKLAPRSPEKAGASTPAAMALRDAGTVLQKDGQPLHPNLRNTMERRFGHDFGTVRVHDDAHAAVSAHALNARAYVVGRHIVFDVGEYRPDTAAGMRLLAHELAHVVQQGAAAFRPGLPLTLSRPSSLLEREADLCATRVLVGEPARLQAAGDARTVQRLLRAEHGTYVSSIGSNPYLEAGEQFYRTWGHPNVKRVANMKQVLDDLDTAKGTIEKFRIVSHGSSMGLELGLLPEIDADYFMAASTGEYTTEARFRKRVNQDRIVNETLFARIYAALWADATTQPLLGKLGGTKDVPVDDSNLGLVMRAIVDAHWLAEVELDSGGKPVVPNADVLQQFVSQRRSRYGELIIKATAKDQQADLRKAIAEIAKLLPAVIATAKITFSPKVTKDEADTLADPFVEKPGKSSGMNKQLAKSLEEGAGGPYLKRLKSVRSKIDSKTHVEIRGCNVGSNTTTMDQLRGFFGNPGALPSMSAPDLFQYFFQLNVMTYRKNQDADLETAFDDSHLGLTSGFADSTRMRAGEMIRLHVGGKLTDLTKKYALPLSLARILELNPEIEKPDEMHSGDVLWLVQRESVPAGFYKTLDDFCTRYLGKTYAWPAVWGANPWIMNPKKPFVPSDQIAVPQRVLTAPFASTAVDKPAFKAAVRGGEAVAGLADQIDVKVATRRGVVTQTKVFDHARPILHLDDNKRNQALGKWLASQKFDPKGRTAAELSKRFGRSGAEFEAGRMGTYVQFLSRGYPNAEDPIFPEDRRYDAHIIKRP